MTRQPTLIRVITWLPMGGIERRIVAVAPRLRALGWNVRICCIREEGPLAAGLREQGIPVDVVPVRGRLSPTGIKALRDYFRRHSADVVHAHMYRSNVPATIAAHWARVPAMFGQIHNVDSWDSGRQAFVDRIVSPWRTATFAVSRAVQLDVMNRLRLSEDRVPLLYNGIDTDVFRPDPQSGRAIRHDLGVDDSRILFVVPARLHPQKNPGGVIAAFARLETPVSGVTPVLAFAGAGKMEAELKADVDRRGLGERVRFLGPRDDMAAVYNAADAIVLSSFKEGFSNAVVEALATGKPVIASDVGGNREAVSDERYGWIHAAGDMDALVSQMSAAIELGRPGLAAREKDCRSRGEEFSLDALVRKTDEYYRQALDRRVS